MKKVDFHGCLLPKLPPHPALAFYCQTSGTILLPPDCAFVLLYGLGCPDLSIPSVDNVVHNVVPVLSSFAGWQSTFALWSTGVGHALTIAWEQSWALTSILMLAISDI
jgi:hypothetical protein